VTVAILQIVGRTHRNPEVDWNGRVVAWYGLWKPEPCGHDADDGVSHAIDGHDASDHPRVGAEPALPQRVAEHGYTIVAGQVLTRPEGPADHGLDAQHTEQLARGLEAEHRLGALATREGQQRIPVRSQAVEYAILLLPVAKVGERGPVGLAARPRAGLVDLHELVGGIVGKRPEHDGLQQAEDR
jgi:hypothetical protein